MNVLDHFVFFTNLTVVVITTRVKSNEGQHFSIIEFYF